MRKQEEEKVEERKEEQPAVPTPNVTSHPRR